MALSLLTVGAGAAGDAKLETIRALGILNGDGTGNLNLSSSVTRAQFVTMMTAASVYQDSVGDGSGVSLFKDVKSDHWASQYIRLAVEQGWVSGYVDGTFRPDNAVTLEEACTALLKLLGYDSSSLAGSYPAAQMSKASALGLRDDLSAAQGQALTRQDCVTLFYNLLTSQTSTGAVYGTTLGYTITNGQVDYTTLVTADTKGPYVAEGGVVSVPFSTDGAVVYRDGAQSSLSAVQSYDVYYYNANLSTIWVYSNRVSGTLTAVAPSAAAPTSVTVSGVSYELGTVDAVYKCSSQGSFSTGDLVTLLLGMNGEVVDVISAADVEMTYYGVVVSSEKVSSTTAGASSATVQSQTVVACTDGVARTFYTGTGTYSVGRLVTVTVDDGGTSIQSMQNKSLSGTVNSAGTTFAGHAFAGSVEILDTDSDGGYVRIYPSRLAGTKLSSDDVVYYTLNENDEIDRLILRDVTGDTLRYVYITSAQESSENMNVSGSYTYWYNGQSASFSGSTVYNVSVGGAALVYEDGQLKSVKQLSSVTLTELGDLSAMAGNKKYLLAEDVTVILRQSGTGGYYAASLSEINTTDYTLKGWYDDLGYSAGGRIRVIVATEIQ